MPNITETLVLDLDEIYEILKLNTRILKDGCWEWTGRKGGTGYGQYAIGGQVISASKLALVYALERDIEPPKQAFHTCFKRDCVNPLHSQEKTAGEIRTLTHAHKLQLTGQRAYRSQAARLTDLEAELTALTNRLQALEDMLVSEATKELGK